MAPCCTPLGKFLNLSKLEFPTERGDSDSILTGLLWREQGDQGKELSVDSAEGESTGTSHHYSHSPLQTVKCWANEELGLLHGSCQEGLCPASWSPGDRTLRSSSQTQGRGEKEGLVGAGHAPHQEDWPGSGRPAPCRGGEKEGPSGGEQGGPVEEDWGGGPRLTLSQRSSPRRSAAQSRPPCWARRWRAPPRTPRAAGGSGC